MTAVNLPYGVPTGRPCPVQEMNQPWPRCDKVGSTEIGLEPGEMTSAFGMDKAGLQGCFCQGCHDDGAEAIEVLDGQSLASSVGQGALQGRSARHLCLFGCSARRGSSRLDRQDLRPDCRASHPAGL